MLKMGFFWWRKSYVHWDSYLPLFASPFSLFPSIIYLLIHRLISLKSVYWNLVMVVLLLDHTVPCLHSVFDLSSNSIMHYFCLYPYNAFLCQIFFKWLVTKYCSSSIFPERKVVACIVLHLWYGHSPYLCLGCMVLNLSQHGILFQGNKFRVLYSHLQMTIISGIVPHEINFIGCPMHAWIVCWFLI